MSNVLIFNVGSSSLTYKVFCSDKIVCSGKANRVNVTGTTKPFIEHHLNGKVIKVETPTLNHQQAAEFIIQFLKENHVSIAFVGHRFVHGGSYFKRSAIIDEAVLKELKECLPLAPIHNPSSFSVIEVSMKELPTTKQYVAIDTAFHSTISQAERTYAIPQPYQSQYLKFGFHGLSYEYVINSLKNVIDVSHSKIIACHLGTGGSSCCGIVNGKSFDTSMGNSTLAGLVMSTRCGDIDPTIPIDMIQQVGVERVVDILNKRSGLLGVSELSSDMRDILHEIEIKGPKAKTCQLAFDVYIKQLAKTIGGLMVEIRGLDLLVFTDQMGLEVWQVRKAICDKMKFLGIELDNSLNEKSMGKKIEFLTTPSSKVQVCVAPNDEELVILQKGKELFQF
ncbi:acetate kinase, putative [Entamoeba dispar SAW760]|uniref:Probable acetate kinase n=1 Tax=Entamoeba dispar (strain ATCC PRA-260 / SAW760) TaxID=370354 RepID=B0EU65_ENTDS|nr:acetate kinase, putative [Entamoeba dispar SAW760]EDR21944.1 acetate kinase, putative [Entamoeba dispar SAW760]|eukprot:EDR21944.1 acetate kinase, putative [Entamoeba dispar SAW760]